MNINVVAHQRNILKTLGIDIWVPRQGSHTQRADYSTYRDVAVFAQQDQLSVQRADKIELRQPEQANTQSRKVEQAADLSRTTTMPVVVDRQIPQAAMRTKTTEIDRQAANAVRPVVVQEPALEVEAFELQAYVLEHCVLLLDVQQVDADQQRLWANIQAAKRGDYYDLKWPFVLAQFQDGRGASLYIQGFIDGLAQDKKVISLGVLPHLENSKVICLASLAEMIAQPILKKRLWQFMQSHRADKEVV